MAKSTGRIDTPIQERIRILVDEFNPDDYGIDLEDYGLDSKKVRSQQVAFAAYIGSSKALVNAWYNGKRTPSRQNIELIAEKCGVPVDWVLGYLPLESRSTDPTVRKIAEYTGLSTTAVETLRALNLRATKEPLEEHEVENLPTYKVTLNGRDGLHVKNVSEEEPTKIGTITCDDPRAEAAATMRIINRLLERTTIDDDDGVIDSVFFWVAEYAFSNNAFAEELNQYSIDGKVVQFLTFNDGLIPKSVNVNDLYKAMKRGHVIAAIDDFVSKLDSEVNG